MAHEADAAPDLPHAPPSLAETIGSPPPELAPPTATAPPTPPPAWLPHADRALFLVLLVFAFLLGSFAVQNTDFWMQLAAGRLLSEGGFTFGVDPFAVTTQDVPWIHQSWLFSWFSYQLFERLGGPVLVVLKALLLVGIVAVLFQARRPADNRWVFVICLTLTALAVSPRFFLQPMAVSLFFLAVTMSVLQRAGLLDAADDGPANPRALWVLPPLFLVWVNVDAWFILGPLAVGLCGLAYLIGAALKMPSRGCGRRLLAVFVVGLLACLVNPFHVRAFQLPPELATVAVRVTEPVGIRLPDALVAGGRTLRDLQRGDGEANPVESPLDPGFFQNRYRGLNVAGFSFYPLLLLGLVSFALAIAVRARPDAPRLQLGRLMIWLVFTLLALLNYRLIPFFAVVAGLITALNLNEFFRWREEQTAAANRSWAGVKLARYVTVPLFLMLLGFAWPGGLHAPFPASSHRVAWEIRPSPHFQHAAEELGRMKARGECKNVFNTDPQIGDYCAWFAPDVKYFIDTRYALFPDAIATYVQAKRDLLAKDQTLSEWPAIAQAYGLDQVFLLGFLRDPIHNEWWYQAERWRQRYNDGNAAIFSWAGPERRWDPDQLRHDWDRLAFGDVPASGRAPASGPPFPGPATSWDLYSTGLGEEPPQVRAVSLKAAYFNFASQRWRRGAWDGAHFLAVTNSVLAAENGGGSVGPVALVWNLLPVVTLMPPKSEGSKAKPIVLFNRMVRGRDAGPPAAPLLAVRLARQAIHENPRSATGYIALFSAYDLLWRQQEDHWTEHLSNDRESIRDRVRVVQQTVALQAALQLQPNNPTIAHELAKLYFSQQLYDISWDYLKLCEEILGELSRTTGDPRQREGLDHDIKTIRAQREAQGRDVEERLKSYELKAHGASPLARYRAALQEPYSHVDENNKQSLDRRGRGLVKPALLALDEALQQKLDPHDESGVNTEKLRLLLALGQLGAAEEFLAARAQQIGPAARFYSMVLLAARGDYAQLLEVLQEFDKNNIKAVSHHARMAVSLSLFDLGPHWTLSTAPAFFGNLAYRSLEVALPEALETKSLLGVMALEAGETALARRTFQEALDLARIPPNGLRHFPDVRLVLRYQQFLDAQAAPSAPTSRDRDSVLQR